MDFLRYEWTYYQQVLIGLGVFIGIYELLYHEMFLFGGQYEASRIVIIVIENGHNVNEMSALHKAKQSLATLTKDVPKRHSVAMPSEPLVNGSQEWVIQAELPLTAAIRQSQQSLYHADRQGNHKHKHTYTEHMLYQCCQVCFSFSPCA